MPQTTRNTHSVLTALILAVGLVLGGLAAAQAPIFAQAIPASNSFLSLTISPPVTYVTLAPGERATHTITLTYDGPTAITLMPKLVNFNPAESGQGIALEETHSFPYLDPNQPNPFQQSLTLEPGNPTQFQIPIAVPTSASLREFHLTVLFPASPSQRVAMGNNQANVAGTIGSNLIVLVSSDGRDLSRLSIKSIQGVRIVDSFGQIKLRALAQNAGPTATIASGSAVIKNGRGNIVQSYDIYPDVILANSSRLLRIIGPDHTDEEPQALDIITHSAPFLLGQYTLEIHLQDAQGNNQATESIQIWALPFLLIAVLLLGILVALGYIFFIKKLPIGKRLKTY